MWTMTIPLTSNLGYCSRQNISSSKRYNAAAMDLHFVLALQRIAAATCSPNAPKCWWHAGAAQRCSELNDSAYTWASGTSMAVPHVAGMAAIYLSNHPRASPTDVKNFLQDSATHGMLPETSMLDGTPNLLLYSRADQSSRTPASARTFSTPP